MGKLVCILGLGYIGLPTAALLANRGFQVHGVDIVPSICDTINQGKIHIVEPDLDTFVKAAVDSGRLYASTKPIEAEVFMICVPTPFHHSEADVPEPNVDYVVSASELIAPYVREGNIVILESTSPVGTTELVRDTLQQKGVDVSKLHIAHCPERVLPGRVMIELIENDRIVGGLNTESTKVVADFYREFVAGEVLETDARTAEMAKLTENSFRDVNIAFANELSMLCDKFNINVWELINLANRHPRVKILSPGCGVGGHCIAVDPWFIVHAGQGTAKLIRTAREVNDYKSEWVLEKVNVAAENFEKKTGRKPLIACMGLAFKPDIDDLRESPALKIAAKVKKLFPSSIVVEPNIKKIDGLTLVDKQEAVDKADIMVFLVKHSVFKQLVPKCEVINLCGIHIN
jgi:UDP-N-acetyl-D-mannosaminuronic acid dehydrogenase